MSDQRIRQVVIVGGGTAGWMAAATLAKTLGPDVAIRLVESDEIATVGVGEATIPQIKLFNGVLGLDEDEFVRETQGTFKLGIEFVDWGKLGDRYLHAFGAVGHDLGLIPFHHYWLRHRQAGGDTRLWDYSLNDIAAHANRFGRLATVGDTKLPGLAYAFHFDAALYAKYLRKYAEQRGVVRTEGKIREVTLREPDGFVASVTLESGETIGGDLFIDCSGFRGLLIEGALKTGYDDWSHWLPCDRALAVPCARTEPLTPYTRATARTAGWQWRIPLQHRTGNGMVYCSRHLSDDEAAKMLMEISTASPGRAAPAEVRHRPPQEILEPQRRGPGPVERLHGAAGVTSIHLIQSGLSRLLSLFPDKRFNPVDIDEYNRQAGLEFERIRDFIVLHYKATTRTDTPFWRDCAAMEIPDTLARKIGVFANAGRLYREDEDLFAEVSWLQVLLGQGIEPATHHPLADNLTEEQLTGFLADLRQILGGAARALPDHAEFIAAHCRA
jgi:tryptophan halogenase